GGVVGGGDEEDVVEAVVELVGPRPRGEDVVVADLVGVGGRPKQDGGSRSAAGGEGEREREGEAADRDHSRFFTTTFFLSFFLPATGTVGAARTVGAAWAGAAGVVAGRVFSVLGRVAAG